MSEFLYTTPPIDRAVALRRHVMAASMHAFGAWGYREIQVPLLHHFEAVSAGIPDSELKRSFRFVDRQGNLMLLRPDVTPLVAQAVTQMRSVKLPLRVSYTHKIVRVERSFDRDELESYQIGLEHIGGDPALADIEILLVALEILNDLKLPGFRISIADHQLASYLLKSSGAPKRIREHVQRALIARDSDELRSMLTRLGTRSQYIEAMLAMASLRGGRRQLEQLRAIFPHDPKVTSRIDYLLSIRQVLEELGYGEQARVELAELTGSSYYTGFSFSILAEGASREVGHGGRYDDLFGHYGRPMSAAGFSMSLETILQVLDIHQALPSQDEPHVERLAVDLSSPIESLKRALEHRRRDQPVHLTPVG